MAQQLVPSHRAKEATHLLPSIRPLLDLPNDQRIYHMKSDYFFLHYPRADEVRAKLMEMISNPKTRRPECVAVEGPTGTGKSKIFFDVASDHEKDAPGSEGNPRLEIVIGPTGSGKTEIFHEVKRVNPDYDVHPGHDAPDKTIVPVAYAQVDIGAGVNLLLGKILKNYYARRWDAGNAARKLERLYNVATACGTRLLIIDDVQRLLDGRERNETVNLIVGLSRELQIPIVLGGVEETARVLEDDTQGAADFPVMELPPWSIERDFKDFQVLMQSLEAVLPLRNPSHLYEAGKARLFFEQSTLLDGRNPKRAGIFRNFIILGKLVAKKSILDGSESISEAHIRDAVREYKRGYQTR